MTTNSKYVIDTHAWLEYFSGSEKGKSVQIYIEGGDAITPTIVIAELSDKYARDEKPYFQQDLDHIFEVCEIVNLQPEIAVVAGNIKNEMRLVAKGFGLVDSIILATARFLGAKIVTGDPHFSTVKDAIKI